jgi:hypothetical protein
MYHHLIFRTKQKLDLSSYPKTINERPVFGIKGAQFVIDDLTAAGSATSHSQVNTHYGAIFRAALLDRVFVRP